MNSMKLKQDETPSCKSLWQLEKQLLGWHAESSLSDATESLQNGASLQWYHVKLGGTVSGTPGCVNTWRERTRVQTVFFTDDLVLTDSTVHSFLGLHSNKRMAYKHCTNQKFTCSLAMAHFLPDAVRSGNTNGLRILLLKVTCAQGKCTSHLICLQHFSIIAGLLLTHTMEILLTKFVLEIQAWMTQTDRQ